MPNKTIPSTTITSTKLAKLRDDGLINLKRLALQSGLNYSTLMARINNQSGIPLDDALKLENELTKLRDTLTKQLR